MKKFLPLCVTGFLFILIIGFALTPDAYEPKILDVENAMEHITVLSGPEMEGRQTGTYGNERAMDYVKKELSEMGFDINPLFFDAQVPFFDDGSIFTFQGEEGQIISLEAFKDYRFSSWGPGGSLTYEGDIVFADDNAYNLPDEVLKDKVVVTEASPYIGDSLATMMNAGVKGILYYPNMFSGVDNAEAYVKMQTLSLGYKSGDLIGLGFINRETFALLKTLARANPLTVDKKGPSGTVYGLIKQVDIKQTMRFETVSTQNFYVEIEGENRDSKIVILSEIDHAGKLNDQYYYPGAIQNASSVSLMLELARAFKESDVKPKQSLIFMVVNASEVDQQGISAMLNEKDMDASHIQVFSMERIGAALTEEFMLTSSGEVSKMLVSKFSSLAQDYEIPLEISRSVSYKNEIFANHGISAITLSGLNPDDHLVGDTITKVSPEQLNRAYKLSQGYVMSEAFPKNPWLLLNQTEKLLIAGVFIYLYMMYVLEELKAHYLWANRLYYSSVVMILKKMGTILTLISILILLVFITKLPRDMNISVIGGTLDTNFSPYLTMKQALAFIRNIFNTGIAEWDFILGALSKSLILYGVAIVFGLGIGIFKGLFDAYSDKDDSEWRSFMSLTVLSVPDIIWILFANFLIVKLNQLTPMPALRMWIFPILTLSIMPIVAVSRVTFVAFEKEKAKPYYLALKSRGISKWRIFSRHLIHPAMESALATMLGLTSVLISNMIIVEYLFDYKGLANFVLIADKTKDQVTFISLIAAISILYVISSAVIRFFIGWMRKGGQKND